MREDMARVIVERPRVPDHGSRKGRRFAPEDMPSHEGMRRPHRLHFGGKRLNENLKPLKRYLDSQVGRPWNAIYSEIASHLRVDNTVQQHVRDHVKDFVATSPFRHKQNRGTPQPYPWQLLFVDPATGLLCRTNQLPAWKARRQAARQTQGAPLERIVLQPDIELRRINGIWYALRMAQLPKPEFRESFEIRKVRLKPYSSRSEEIEIEVKVRRLVTPSVRDAATNKQIEVGPAVDDPLAWGVWHREHAFPCYAVAKRALSRRELRRHGLRNLEMDTIA